MLFKLFVPGGSGRIDGFVLRKLLGRSLGSSSSHLVKCDSRVKVHSTLVGTTRFGAALADLPHDLVSFASHWRGIGEPVIPDRTGKLILQVIDVNLPCSGVLDDAHQGSLQVFDLLSPTQQLLQIIVQPLLRHAKLLVFMAPLFHLLIHLLDLSVGEVKFLLGPLNVCEQVRLRLVCSLSQPLVQLHIGHRVLHFILQLLDLHLQLFALFLLMLQPIGK